MILGVIDGATIHKSLAEILSGPVAFPASNFYNFLRTSASVIPEKRKVVRQGAGDVRLVDAVDVAGRVLRLSMRLLATMDSSGGAPLLVK